MTDFAAIINGADLDDGSTANSSSDLKDALRSQASALNGSIEAANLAAACVTAAKLADSVNPQKRWEEFLPNAKDTATGLLFSTTAGTSVMAAGIAVLGGYRISVAASEIQKAWGSHENKDAYVYMRGSDKDLNYLYVDHDANAPDTPSGYVPICLVKISVTATCTSCSSLIGTQITRPEYKDYITGLIAKSVSNTLYLYSGEMSLPNSGQTDFVRKRLTSTATLTTERMDAGSSYANSKGYFVYAHSTNTLEALVKTDFIISTASTTASVTGVKTYAKKIGWFYTSSAGIIISHTVGGYYYNLKTMSPGALTVTSSTTLSASGTTATASTVRLYSTYPALDAKFGLTTYIETTASATTIDLKYGGSSLMKATSMYGVAKSYIPIHLESNLTLVAGWNTIYMYARTTDSANPYKLFAPKILISYNNGTPK